MQNLFINQVRAEARAPMSPLDDDAPDLSVRATQEDGLAVRDLATALGLLPEDYRTVVLLVGLEELSYEATARVLGIPVGTVMSRLSRGRERLRALMAGERVPALRRVK
jgi:RNA polymerase sigma-70 factor (ECF subfamily)